VDQAMETMKGFRAIYDTMNWGKFEESDKYLSVDVSIRLFRHLLKFHNHNVDNFVNDVWLLLTFSLPKTNLIFLHGVPNSGKSFVIRSIAALYKYSATVQGTS
ncbi:hypothetical protein LSAT2_020063, partial [Lamellibrachia satsuma]